MPRACRGHATARYRRLLGSTIPSRRPARVRPGRISADPPSRPQAVGILHYTMWRPLKPRVLAPSAPGRAKNAWKTLGGMSQHGMSSARRSFAVATAPGRGPASNLSREPPPAVMSRTLSPTWTSSRNFIQSAPLVVADRAHRRRPAAPDGVGQPIMPAHPCRPASIAPARSSLDPELSIPS